MSNPSYGSPTGPAEKIDFNCSRCNRHLQVPREAIGRQAQCPECNFVQTVPGNVVSPTTSLGASSTVDFPRPQEMSSPPSFSTPQSARPPVAGGGQLRPPAATIQPPTPTPPSVVTNHQPTASPMPKAAPKLTGIAMGQYGTAHSQTRELFERIRTEIQKLFVGQDELVLGSLVALFSGGHVLIESVPGLGKTLFVRTLGRVMGCQFGRIQFTADLMPSDITGAPIFNVKTQEFTFRPGPVFTQLLLADEINRSPAKTHAALLEIMQEFRVTIDGTSHPIEQPFLVLATQNPIESEGTYNLPEAQLDRFMFKLIADYPTADEEADILRLHSRQVDVNERLEKEVENVTSPEEILRVAHSSNEVHVDDKLIDYINKVVRLTRNTPQLHMGASPRAGLALMRAARTLAAFFGRDYAVPDDVVMIALPALRHRVILTAEAEVEGHKVDEVLTQLIRSVEVPRL